MNIWNLYLNATHKIPNVASLRYFISLSTSSPRHYCINNDTCVLAMSSIRNFNFSLNVKDEALS